jgi:hypothetical protein
MQNELLEQPKVTLAEALKALLLTKEELSDLTLKGKDGSTVRANRAMLAARSPVFHRMLYGQFSEAEQSVVELGYTGDVLKEIVEYIHTDTALILT